VLYYCNPSPIQCDIKCDVYVLQVPQMILDDCHAHNRPCRIFCTQPRRLSALSIAERVAAERGEKIGQTVGYQIRLESRQVQLLVMLSGAIFVRVMEGRLRVMMKVLFDRLHCCNG